MADAIPFAEVARLPAKGDNAAIALRQLEAGTKIDYNGATLELPFTILMGHRFAVQPIKAGDYVTSWNSPFGKATTDIAPGDFIRNAAALEKLPSQTTIKLPRSPNLSDDIPPYEFDEANFTPPKPLQRLAGGPSFMGFPRGGNRGTGTRNKLVLLGTTASTGAFVKQLEEQVRDLARPYENVDGIVALAHTEGSRDKIGNRERVLQTLAGLAINPNVGGIIAVDRGDEQITNAMLLDWMKEHHYPIDSVPHHFITLGDFSDTMQQATQLVKDMLPEVNKEKREKRPVSELNIAMQCGGSDAFSGISSNPLAGAVVRKIIEYGGSANLTETDELISAEDYVLKNVRDAKTARRFLEMGKKFEANLNKWGHSGLSNPSGGNFLRGLVNIYLKSKGAATKKDPDVGIEHVIDYADRMLDRGYHFMNGPGNDLEGQAGQMAAGCNMVFFSTGNGSITNFPLAPTIKFVSTTERYNHVGSMDVNAGRYLEGVPMEQLADETLDLAVKIASGQRCKGEEEGLAQLQIWRDEPKSLSLPIIQPGGKPQAMRESGEPVRIVPVDTLPAMKFSGFKKPGGSIVSQQVGLVIPTSLCAGEWANAIAKGLQTKPVSPGGAVRKFSALAHTEGCGATNSAAHTNTTLGYMTHPSVAMAYMLEHGCESMHSGRFKEIMQGQGHDFEEIGQAMKAQHLKPDDYGWGSIQKDGGIEKAVSKARGWFKDHMPDTPRLEAAEGSWKDVRLGLMSNGAVSQQDAADMANLAREIVTAGGTVVIPENDPLLRADGFTKAVFGANTHPAPTLSYGQNVTKPGLHVMSAPSAEWGEIMTGLGATGVESIIAHSEKTPLTSHPFIPVIHVTTNGTSKDFDMTLGSGDAQARQSALQTMLEKTLSREYTPKLTAAGNTIFQISRGTEAVTL